MQDRDDPARSAGFRDLARSGSARADSDLRTNTGEEIRRRLSEFAAAWGGYAGTERTEAQTFLNGLLECYGTDRRAEGARFEERTADGFMDLFWPGVCIVEMKGWTAKASRNLRLAPWLHD